jgi:hypothetical protein
MKVVDGSKVDSPWQLGLYQRSYHRNENFHEELVLCSPRPRS